VRGLARRGHEVDVVLPHHPEFRYPDGERVRFFPYRYSPLARLSPWGFGQTFDAKARVGAQVLPLLPAIALSLRRAIQRRLAAEDHDVVHAHWLLPNGWAAASVAGRAEVPVVVTLHGSDVAMAERHLPLRRMARQTFGRVAAVTATSDDLRRRALELGAEPRAATVTYIGVDAERFAPRPADRETRRLLGAEEGDLLVVAVGRLARVKGFEYVIEAASRLPRVALAIVGEGELRPELELLVGPPLRESCSRAACRTTASHMCSLRRMWSSCLRSSTAAAEWTRRRALSPRRSRQAGLSSQPQWAGSRNSSATVRTDCSFRRRIRPRLRPRSSGLAATRTYASGSPAEDASLPYSASAGRRPSMRSRRALRRQSPALMAASARDGASSVQFSERLIGSRRRKITFSRQPRAFKTTRRPGIAPDRAVPRSFHRRSGR